MSTKKRDYAISIIRALSLLLVIGCHILEWLYVKGGNYPLAVRIVGNYFAIGVQLFLLVSGFLYGSRESLFQDGTSRVEFVVKNFWKILKDYYVHYLVVIIPLCIIFQNETMTWDALFGALTGWRTFGGEGHLWFIPYILFCYLITPMLYDIREYICKKNVVVCSSVLLILVEVLFLAYKSYFIPAWICCYVIGFFFPKLKNTGIWRRSWYLLAGIACGLGNGIKIWLFYYMKINPSGIEGIKGVILQECYNWVQVLLAVVLFVGLYEVLHKWLSEKQNIKILDLADRYSYDIYLSHMVFVKGMLSTVFLTGILCLDIIVTFVLIISSGILLYYVVRPRMLKQHLRRFR